MENNSTSGVIKSHVGEAMLITTNQITQKVGVDIVALQKS
jgi:hypothetical protein